MATYLIGDVQGCQRSLETLLKKISVQSDDVLCFAGDLVNRGPRSLEVLRYLCHCPWKVRAVLGNHDLWALCRYYLELPGRPSDSLESLLNAPDAGELFRWLHDWPLVEDLGGTLLVHAGLHPSWTHEESLELSSEISVALKGPDRLAFLRELSARAKLVWSSQLSGIPRLIAATAILTRIRICDAEGNVNFKFNQGLEAMPPGFHPWYAVPGRKQEATVAFGHWAAHGVMVSPQVIALDSGCVWGRELSAVRLEDKQVFQVSMVD